MPDIKISQLAAASELASSDALEVVQAGVSKKINGSALRAFPIKAQDGNYTLALVDELKTIARTVGVGDFTWTIPNNAAVALPVGARVRFANLLNTTAVTIAPASGVTLRSEGSKSGAMSLQAGMMVEAQKVGANEWLIIGGPQSGSYTPAIVLGANAATAQAYKCQWSRVGPVVTVSGRVDITATVGGGTVTSITLSLPVPSDLASAISLNGVANVGEAPYATATIRGDGGGTDTAQLIYYAQSTVSRIANFVFQYLVE